MPGADLRHDAGMRPVSRICRAGVNELPPDGRLVYEPGFIDAGRTRGLNDRLSGELDWRQRTIFMFGRETNQPRLVAWYGEPGIRYTYSGKTLEARGWHPELEHLRDRLTDRCGICFNSVLCNLYRDGADGMGWHSDDEPELGPRPCVASLSLGGRRRFVLRRRGARDERMELIPEPGSLIVMDGDIQDHWQHAVPKTARPVAPRINLTFRRIIS